MLFWNCSAEWCISPGPSQGVPPAQPSPEKILKADDESDRSFMFFIFRPYNSEKEDRAGGEEEEARLGEKERGVLLLYCTKGPNILHEVNLKKFALLALL